VRARHALSLGTSVGSSIQVLIATAQDSRVKKASIAKQAEKSTEPKH